MQLSPTANITSQAQSFLDGPKVRTAKKELDSNDFLQLLATQMTTQDPMKPMEDTQFMAQMASFTSLEQMKTLTENMTAFTTQQSISTASQYLGKNVTVAPPNSTSITGTVTGVLIANGKPQITINNANYDLETITSVKIPTTVPVTPPEPANPPAEPAQGEVGTGPTIPTAQS